MDKKPFTLNNAEFRKLQHFLHHNSGLQLLTNRKRQLELVIRERLKELNLEGTEDYITYITSHPLRVKEQQKLIDELTITESYFFRNRPHWDVFKEYLLPELAEKKKDKKLKIWSAGCANGEEPFTIAIILYEMNCLFPGWRIEICGSDVNSESLKNAQEGKYNSYSLRMMAPAYLEKYFVKKNDYFYLVEEIRNSVKFEYLNLIKEPYPLEERRDFDIIFCRNVTIYFKKSSTERVIHNFFNSLNDGGYLFIGHAETLHNVNDEFTFIEIGETFLYRKLLAKKSLSAEPRGFKYADFFISSPTPPPDSQIVQRELEERLKTGQTYLADGEYEPAILEFEKIISQHPYLIEAYLLLGKAYADRKLYSQALKHYREALVQKPLNAEIHFLMGLVYWESEETAEAVNLFRKAKYLNHNFCLPYYYLGLWYEKEKIPGKAANEFNAALKVLKNYPGQFENPIFEGFKMSAIESSCREKIKLLAEPE